MQKNVTLFVLSLFALLGTANAQDDILPVDEVFAPMMSSLEISLFIRGCTQKTYDKSYLNNNSASNYTTSYQQALNLGVYIIDLAIAKHYGKNQTALGYLKHIQSLTDSLNITALIPYNKIREQTEKAGSFDDFNGIRHTTFASVDAYLQANNKGCISALCLTGYWVESLYLTALINQQLDIDILKEKIADQRVILKSLLFLLDKYKADTAAGLELIKDLSELQKVYKQIEVEVLPEQPKLLLTNEGNLEVVSYEEVILHFDDVHIEMITTQITHIRNKIINNQYN